MFGLTNQLRRASVSIASNIAEGQGRLTTGEFTHFLGMAGGSALEVQTQIEVAKMLKLGIESELKTAENTSDEVVRILNAAIATNKTRLALKPSKNAKPQSLYSLLLSSLLTALCEHPTNANP